MGSPITFSGFNSIDFNLILTSIMRQESQPLEALQTRQAALQSRATSFTTLSARVSSLQQAASALAKTDTVDGYQASSSDPTAASVSAGAKAIPGRYEVVVNDLARAQVTASTTVAPDADSTIVASGGTITISGVTVTLAGASTLRQVADAINASSNPPARATVVQSGPNAYRLVLTAKDTGVANAFTITNNLTGGTGVTFGDADGDGTSGDSAADNAVQASDASLLVNNIAVTSTTNVLESAIPGVTLTVFKKDPSTAVVVDVTADSGSLKSKVQTFVDAYNDLIKFSTDQSAAAGRGDAASIGRDPLLRQLRSQLQAALSSEYATASTLTALSQAGIEFTQTGTIKLNDQVFDEAVKASSSSLVTLFAGSASQPGAFAALDTLLDSYSKGDGLLPGASRQLTEQATRITGQITAMSDRLALRRAALQREFVAADQAMTLLKNQSGSLASFGAQL